MRAFPSAAIGAAALLALATFAHADRDDRPRVWSDRWQVSGRPEVRVRAGDARVRIHTREGSEVAVEARMVGSARGWYLGDRDPEVRFSRQGSRIDISAFVRGVRAGIVLSTLRLQVDVWVPRETDLFVRTSDGDVTLGPLAGQIQVETTDGDIEALGLAGDILLASADGDIDAGELDGRLVLRTRDGNGLVGGRFDALTLRSTDGRLEVVAGRGSVLREPWSIESRDGRIALRIPRDLKASIDARATDGPLAIDLPVSVQGRFRRNQLRGDLNGGGPTLFLRSTDGGIRVSALD